ncbi:MAG: hypothetical protein HZB95_08530 [Nitrosomonadales bacterium]|nr:hypothetical protein [Nitrosomonadales bacterium]
MDHLRLLIPDLFPPQDIAAEVCEGLRLPALEKLLARGRVQAGPAEPMEEWLCAAYAVHAVAPLRAAADGLDTSDGYWLCADPVNLQLHRAQMMLIPDVAATREEAAALCDNLNAHFAGQGMRFFAPHPQRWYLRLQAAPLLATTPLRQAAWQDAKFHQPQGDDVLHWQRVMTEVQMLLYAHAVNQVRQTRGELLIGSLWLWGGGLAETAGRPFDVCGSDGVLSAAFAHISGASQRESVPALLDGKHQRGLWVCEGLRDARLRGDFARWRELVQQVETDCAFLLQALQSGRLRKLTLHVLQADSARDYESTRAAAWKFWRPARSLAEYAV